MKALGEQLSDVITTRRENREMRESDMREKKRWSASTTSNQYNNGYMSQYGTVDVVTRYVHGQLATLLFSAPEIINFQF